MRGRRKELDTPRGQIQNFLRNVQKSDGCWLWLGTTNGSYGRHKFFGKPWPAHRLAYWIFVKEFDKSLDVCHHCDNPLCVRPNHLFLGTHQDNMRDMVSKGRNAPTHGSLNYKAKLSEARIHEIRELYLKGGTSTTKLGKQYGVHFSTIARIVNGKSWKHVTGV